MNDPSRAAGLSGTTTSWGLHPFEPLSRSRFAACAGLALALLLPQVVAASPRRLEISRVPDTRSGQNVEIVSSELLVRFRTGYSEEQKSSCLRRNGLARVKVDAVAAAATSAAFPERIGVPLVVNLEALLIGLRDEKEILFAEPNFVLRATAAEAITALPTGPARRGVPTDSPMAGDPTGPNDPLYSQQWGLGAIGAPAAWFVTMGDPSVVVAVVDTGIDGEHADLRNHLVPGYDFVHHTDNQRDDNGHGTFCAGIIGAEANNGIGIAGVAPRVSLMPLKALDAAGEGTTAEVAEAIVWAADHGARIVNLSLGGPAYSHFLQEAVDYALGKGCILVAAGGNDGTAAAVYPAAYPEVLGVAAVASGGLAWPRSNTGPHITLAAPGEAIVSTGPRDGYATASGTSAAAAFVAGAAALVTSVRPELSGAVVGRLLVRAAHDFGATGRDPVFGWGVVDAAPPLAAAVAPVHDVALRHLAPASWSLAPGEPIVLQAALANVGTYRQEVCDVHFFRVEGRKREALRTEAGIGVRANANVSIPVPRGEPGEALVFAASAECAGDRQPSNDERQISFSATGSEGIVTLYPNDPPVHGWNSYQAFKLLENDSNYHDLYAEMSRYVETDQSACVYSGGAPSGLACGPNGSFAVPDVWKERANPVLSFYCQDLDGCPPPPADEKTALIEGAWAEDYPFTRSTAHFWNLKNPNEEPLYHCGLHELSPPFTSCASSSALKKAQESLLPKATTAYFAGKPHEAYYWLGRISHLLADMTVPAHVLDDSHISELGVGDVDNYEWFTGSTDSSGELNFRKITSTSAIYMPGALEPYGGNPVAPAYDSVLSSLFYTAALQGSQFDSDGRVGHGGSFEGWSIGNGWFRSARIPFSGPLPSQTTVVKVEQCTLISCWELTPSFDYQWISNSCDNRVYLSAARYSQINSTGNSLRVTYGSGTSEHFWNLDEETNGIWDEPLECIYQPKLQGTAIGAIAQLYKHFWDLTRPPTVPPPTVVSSGASSITPASATLNGQVDPRGSGVETYFEFGTAMGYGRVASAAPQSGSGLRPVSAQISGLSCDTLYHFRAVAKGASVPVPGEDLTFRTSSCPATYLPAPVPYSPPNGGGNQLTSPVLMWQPVANAASYRVMVARTLTALPTDPSAMDCALCVVNTTTSATYLAGASLSPSTTYYWQVHARGSDFGLWSTPWSFTTTLTVGAPTAATGAASSIGGAQATLSGTASPNNGSTAIWFDYGPTTSYGSSLQAATLTGSALQSVTAPINGLACGGLSYHFRIRAVNAIGIALGADASFTTGACPVGTPVVSTSGASGIGMYAATLNGFVNAGGASTTTSFDLGPTAVYSMSLNAQTVGGTSSQQVSALATNLACGWTYHFRVKASNSAGTQTGSDMTFTTGTCPVGTPGVTTGAATGIGPFGATLNGGVTPNGGQTTASFEYGANALYGTAIAAGSVSGSGAQAITATLTSLACNTVYHYRAVGTNSAGTGTGADESFVTAACPATTPTATVGFGSTICAGDLAGLWANLTGGGPWTVTWSDGVTSSGITATPFVRAVTPQSTTGYTLTSVSNPAGNGTAAGTIVVTVNPRPSNPVITAPAVVLSGTGGYVASVPDQPDTTFEWTVTNGSATGGYTTHQITFAAEAVGSLTLSVRARSQAYCSSEVATATAAVAPGAAFQPARYTFTRLAGTPGRFGWEDGVGESASVGWLSGIVVDDAGYAYFSDSSYHVIRRVKLATGEVTTVAGRAGSSGSVDGIGAAARFSEPAGLALDGSGALYVADASNNTIRRIVLATGVVSTFAGTAGTSGVVDAAGAAARFTGPHGMAYDGSGYLYIADSGSRRIRRLQISSASVVTIAGGTYGTADGFGTAAQFETPDGLAYDPSGYLVITEYWMNTVRRMNLATTEVVTLAGVAGWSGGYQDGTGAGALFNTLHGVISDGAGTAIVGDSGNGLLRRVNIATGAVTTWLGIPAAFGVADGPCATAGIGYTLALGREPSGGVVFADHSLRIRRVSPSSCSVSTVAGSVRQQGSADGAAGDALFFGLDGLAVATNGDVFVADYNNHTIRKVSFPSRAVTTIAGSAVNPGTQDGTGPTARLRYPVGVAVDGGGNVFVTDSGNHTIRRIDAVTGAVSTLAGSPGQPGSADGVGSTARFNRPWGIACAANGDLWVADYSNRAIRRVSSIDGSVVTVAGLAGSSGEADGIGTAARFSYPGAVAIDSGGMLYVADGAAVRSLEIATGMVATVAGMVSQQGSIDGQGIGARFGTIRGMVMMDAGMLYVSDGNGTIRAVTVPDAVVATVAGGPVRATLDGTSRDASVYWPGGMAKDSSGSIYVSDSNSGYLSVGKLALPDAATIDASIGPVGQVRLLRAAPATGTNVLWELVRRPASSIATLSSTTVANPTFTPDVADLYVFRLTTSDASGARSISTVSLNATGSSICTPPATPTPTNDGPTCTGGSVHLSTPSVSGGTYSWTGPMGYSSTEQSPTLSGLTDENAGTYYLIVQAGSCTSVAGSTVVVVNEKPAPPAITAPSSVFCEQAGLLASVEPHAGSTYIWAVMNGAIDSGQGSSQISFTTGRGPAVTLTVTETSSSGCISPAGSWAISASCPSKPAVAASTTGPTCEGGAIRLFAPTVSGAAYSWTGPSGFSSPVQNPAISNATTAMSGAYTVTVSGDGCMPPPGTVQIVVLPVPGQPTASNDGPTCEGGTVQLGAAYVPDGTYAWMGPDGFTSRLRLPTLSNVTPEMAGDYSVTVTIGGCTSTAATTTLVVDPSPVTPAITAPGRVRPGQSFTAFVPEVAGVSYSWAAENGVVTAGSGTQQVTVTAGIEGAVTLSVTETNTATGCISRNASAVVAIGLLATGFEPLAPCRLFDTRESTGDAAAAPALAPGETRTLSIGTRCGIPAPTVRSLAVNQTVTQPTANGELVVYRGDLTTIPITSSISFQAGRTRANNGILELSTNGDGTVSIHNRSTGSVHFILDVAGMFR